MNPLYSQHIDKYIYLDNCGSTNEYALNMLSNNDPKSNYCVYTHNQTAGRGQIGRYWYSGTDKNLSSSYKIPLLNFKVKDQFLINIGFSLAVYSFLSRYITQDLSIKWPNDIYVGDKKIAGLLIQNNLRSDSINTTILGVGINVNETAFPLELPNPVSMTQVLDQTFDLKELQYALSTELIQHFQQLLIVPDKYKERYISKLYRRDIAAPFTIADQPVEGIIKGITPTGKLILEINGQDQEFNFRELRYVIE